MGLFTKPEIKIHPAAYEALCKERDALSADNKRLNEAYGAMFKDLQFRTNQLAEARAELARLKAETE